MLKRIIQFPFHPPLIALYSPLSFLAYNRKEVLLEDSARTFLVVLVGVLMCYLLIRLLIKETLRATMVLSFIATLFFSYGQVYQFLHQQSVFFGVDFGRHRYLAVFYLVIAILGIRWLLKKRDLAAWVIPVNTFAIVLLAIPFFQVICYPWGYQSTASISEDSAQVSVELVKPVDPPDIYYIIADSYTRDDVMSEFYDYDNTPFLSELEERGFYVARCGRSNYEHTHLSLGSSLNLDYIPEVYPREGVNNLPTLVRANIVRASLEAVGYRTIAFDSAYPHTAWKDIYRYFSYSDDHLLEPMVYLGLTEYETMFLRTTAGLILLDVDRKLDLGFRYFVEVTPLLRRYDRIEYNLDKMMSVPTMDGQKFVFVHLLIPHDPYIFDSSGEFQAFQEDYKAGYRGQVMYLNSRLLEFIDYTLDVTRGNVIIIIQGDHGAPETLHSSRRLSILNAYYLPEGGNHKLYPSVTPVNTFRIIFDTYFGTELGLLPDMSYLTSPEYLFDFTYVPEMRAGCE